MKWRERVIVGGLILAVIGTTAMMAGRQYVLKQEQDAFGVLRREVEKHRERQEKPGVSTKFLILGDSDLLLANESKRGEILPEYQGLYNKNRDFAGWVSIEGTEIDYPVMQNLADREYYLHRDFYKNDSYAGVPFIGRGDINQESGALFLYGHNMKNGTMFADLLKYESKEYWETHPEIMLSSLWEYHRYNIFAAFRVTETEWTDKTGLFYFASNGQAREDEDKIKELKDRAIYETGITPKASMSLLYLITCSYQQKNERFVVIAER